jgi:SAM-dependent methyltransferase
MAFLDTLLSRSIPPKPWLAGEKIPWNEAGFSERMLKEHLSQDHNAASRRMEIIDQHISWIDQFIDKENARILDLGCGPGLYSQRLAKRGHRCTGIDFGPASIAYAREQAADESLEITYRLEDIRDARFGTGYDLVIFIFGEFNAFTPRDAAKILDKAADALTPGGRLLIEPHPFDFVQRIGSMAASWSAAHSGLFSPRPHLWLREHFWDSDSSVAVTRHSIVEDDSVNMHYENLQAYTNEAYQTMLESAGFDKIELRDAIGPKHDDLFAITAKKR